MEPISKVGEDADAWNKKVDIVNTMCVFKNLGYEFQTRLGIKL